MAGATRPRSRAGSEADDIYPIYPDRGSALGSSSQVPSLSNGRQGSSLIRHSSTGSSAGSRALTVDIVSAKILRRHAEYTIDVFLSGRKVWTVERRYTHFRLVHKDLKRNSSHKDCILSGMAGVSPQCDLPRLPSRVLVKNLNREFVESRRVALQVYLEGVLRLYGSKIPHCVWELLGLGGRLRAAVLTSDAAELMASTHGFAQRFRELHASVYASVQASVMQSNAASGHASVFSLSASGITSDQESDSEDDEDEDGQPEAIPREPHDEQEQQSLVSEQEASSFKLQQQRLDQSRSQALATLSPRIPGDDDWLRDCEALFKNTWNSA